MPRPTADDAGAGAFRASADDGVLAGPPLRAHDVLAAVIRVVLHLAPVPQFDGTRALVPALTCRAGTQDVQRYQCHKHRGQWFQDSRLEPLPSRRRGVRTPDHDHPSASYRLKTATILRVNPHRSRGSDLARVKPGVRALTVPTRRPGCARRRYREAMLLYHSTDPPGRAGIEGAGFALSHLRDSPGASWFIDSRNPLVPTGRVGWWVIVDLPDDVAEAYREPDDDGLRSDLFCVPWHVANAHRPFRFEEQSSAERSPKA